MLNITKEVGQGIHGTEFQAELNLCMILTQGLN